MDNKKKIKKGKTPLLKPKTWAFLVLCIGAVIAVFPFLWALGISVLERGNWAYDVSKFLKLEYMVRPLWANYIEVLSKGNFARYTLNTLFLTGVCIFGTCLSNSFIAFGFARYKFKGAEVLFFLAICTMFIPGTVMTVPGYLLWKWLGGLGTYLPLCYETFLGSSMSVFWVRQGFKSLPQELYEAALIDGAHPIYIWARIYMPLAKAIITVIAVRAFMGNWGNLFGPLIYLDNPKMYTMAVGLQYISSIYRGQGHILMAASMISIFPCLIVYAFAQRYFIEGLSASAVKG